MQSKGGFFIRDLSLHLMDIVQNSIVAEANFISIAYNLSPSLVLEIKIGDNGKGMTAEQVNAAQDPFYTTRTTRNIGLGLPLLKMSAEKTGGSFLLNSELGVGTELTARFNTSHIDMLPLGDTASTLLLLITGNPEIDFLFEYSFGEDSFKVDTKEINEILDGLPVNSPEIVVWLKGYLEEGFNSLDLL